MTAYQDIRGVLVRNPGLPAGLDGKRLAIWRLKNGRTYEEVRSELAQGFQDYNEEILSIWGDMLTVTDNDFFRYPNGGIVRQMKQLSGGARPETVKGNTSGHMIPLVPWGQSIGSDWRYFRDTFEEEILADITAMVTAGRDLIDQSILNRAFSNTDNLLGDSGYDVGFCNGSPNANTGGVAFAPLKWNGKTFDYTHTHYIGYDSSSGKTFDDVISGLALTINEHGHNGPYTIYASEADVSTLRGLTNYIKPVSNINIIDRGGATTGNIYFEDGMILAQPPSGARYIGGYDTGYGPAYIRATNRIPTGYMFMYKSYGSLSPKNPIALRIHPDFGFGFRIMEIPSAETTWPVKEVDVEAEYGVSCGKNRTIGACGLLTPGGTYVAPTIS
jgi:hypothetical protein